MRDALKARGYAYRYVYAESAGHRDPVVVNQTLSDALVWLSQDCRAK